MTKATYKRKHLIWWWFQRVHDGRVKGRSRAHSLIHKHEAEKEKSLESIETSKTFSQWCPSPNKATLLNASQTVLPSGDQGFKPERPVGAVIIQATTVGIWITSPQFPHSCQFIKRKYMPVPVNLRNGSPSFVVTPSHAAPREAKRQQPFPFPPFRCDSDTCLLGPESNSLLSPLKTFF